MITFKQIGDELKNQRAFLGLSRREVASRAGIAHSTLSTYENGYSIHVNTLQQIVSALGLTMGDFYDILEGYGAERGVSPLGVDTFEASGTEEEVAEAYEAWCTEGAPYTYKVYGQTNLHFRRAFARTPIKNAIALTQEERRLLDFLYTVNHRDAVKVKDEYARELEVLVQRGYAFLTEDGAAFAKLYW